MRDAQRAVEFEIGFDRQRQHLKALDEMREAATRRRS
jgi:hypothetical protein